MGRLASRIAERLHRGLSKQKEREGEVILDREGPNCVANREGPALLAVLKAVC